MTIAELLVACDDVLDSVTSRVSLSYYRERETNEPALQAVAHTGPHGLMGDSVLLFGRPGTYVTDRMIYQFGAPGQTAEQVLADMLEVLRLNFVDREPIRPGAGE